MRSVPGLIRLFSDAELVLIRTLIAEHDPPLNRAALSRVVCERLDWRKPDGGLKDMSARVAPRENRTIIAPGKALGRGMR